jgi:hypothetical protein
LVRAGAVACFAAVLVCFRVSALWFVLLVAVDFILLLRGNGFAAVQVYTIACVAAVRFAVFWRLLAFCQPRLRYPFCPLCRSVSGTASLLVENRR